MENRYFDVVIAQMQEFLDQNGFTEKDGIYADVSVVVKYGYNVPELAYRIQQSVKQSVENMTHYKVAEVDVHVLDVVFNEPTATETVEKEEEPRERSVSESEN